MSDKLRKSADTGFSNKRRRISIATAIAVILTLLLYARQIQRPKESLIVEQQYVETVKPQVCVHTLLENEVQEYKILRSLELVREMGASTIVQFFPWVYAEPAKGEYKWGIADRIIRHARLQGLRVIARLGLVPAWARANGSTDFATLNSLPESSFPYFADYAAAFAARYAAEVEHIIIWNEPNLSFEWGYRQVDPAAYTRLLQKSFERVKAVNPGAIILAGALAPTLEPAGSAAGMNDLDFLNDMYRNGAGAYFDALAIHTYGFRDSPSADPAADRLNFRRAELLREIMIAHGDTEKPAYITESGWNDHPRWTGAVRPSQRAAYTVQAFEYVEDNWDWIENLCIWAFRYPADTLTYPDNYTLVNADFLRKPIYFELQAYARGWERREIPWLPAPKEDK